MHRSPWFHAHVTRRLALVTTLAFLGTILLPPCVQLAEAEERDKPTIRFFHHDHLGSVTMVTDEQGRVVESYTYKPFGEVDHREVRDPRTGQVIVGDLSPSMTRHGFTGQRHDTSTGLYYYKGRYYDPQLGRFTQPDPFVQDPADPQSLNRYAYVRNNPLNLVDPSGHFWFIPLLLAVVKAAAIGAAVSVALGAATGQIDSWSDVGRLAAVGAASGAVFGAGGFAIGAQGFALAGAAKTVAGFGVTTAAGALGGGIDSAMQGGSFGQGAGYGALFAGGLYGATLAIGVGIQALASSPLGEAIGQRALAAGEAIANSAAVRGMQGLLARAGFGSARQQAVALARATQGTRDYPGIDAFEGAILKQGSIVYGGEPGVTGWFTTQSAVTAAGTDSAKLFRSLQVKPQRETNLFRPGITAFEAIGDTAAAVGHAMANTRWGPGGALQLFIPTYQRALRPLYSILMKNRQAP